MHTRRFTISLALLMALLALPLVPVGSGSSQEPAAEPLRFIPPVGHALWITSVAFGPDGKLAASGSGDGTVRLWEVETAREVRLFEAGGARVYSVAFSPDGRQLLAGAEDGAAWLWEVASGREITVFSGAPVPRAAVHSAAVAFVGGGEQIAALDGGRLRLREAATGRDVAAYPVRGRELAVSPAGDYFFVAGDPEEAPGLSLREVATGREVCRLTDEDRSIRTAVFSWNGARVLGYTHDNRFGRLVLWDVATGELVRRSPDGVIPPTSLAISPDGRLALIGEYGGEVEIWDLEAGRRVRTFVGVGRDVAATFGPDGRYVLAGGLDGRLVLWETETGKEVRVVHSKQTEMLRALAVRPGSLEVLAGNGDWGSGMYGSVRPTPARLWDLATGRQVRTFEGHRGEVPAVAFTRDGRLATSIAHYGHYVWDVETGQALYELPWDGRWVPSGVAFSADGRRIAATGATRRLYLTDLAADGGPRRITADETPAAVVALSTYGERALTSRPLRFWTLQDDRWVATAEHEGVTLHSANRGAPGWLVWTILSPDGRLAAARAEGEDDLRLWDAANGEALLTLPARDGPLRPLAFSPDASLLLTTTPGGALELWETETGRRQRGFERAAHVPTLGAFTSDGRHVVLGYLNGMLRLWEVETGRLLFTHLVLLGGEDWLLWTPDGRFDGTEAAIAQAHFARGLETVPVEDLAERLRVPGLAGRVLGDG